MGFPPRRRRLDGRRQGTPALNPSEPPEKTAWLNVSRIERPNRCAEVSRVTSSIVLPRTEYDDAPLVFGKQNMTLEPSARRLAAIMFTDMVGYSALAQRDEALALELLAIHQAEILPVFTAHGGRVIKSTGDGFLIEFTSALQAVHCAIEIQTMLHEQHATAEAGRRVEIRIGLHLGDVEVRDGDLFGDGVNIAARLEPLAVPGGVCISGPVFDQVQNKLAVPLVKLARPEMKNIQVPIDVYRVVLPWENNLSAASSRSTVRNAHAPIALATIAGALILAGGGLWWQSRSAETVATTTVAASAPPEEDRKSIAVLPFVNMSSDKENEYFSDGVTEDLLTALSKISGLRVASRTSSFAFKGKNEDISAIGRKLHVGVILEGSVARSGNQVRITAQLVNAENGYHLWSESYDRDMQDIFAIRSEVAQTVAKALEVTLLENERATIDQKPTEDLEAYQLYLKGCQQVRTYVSWEPAMRYFQQAIAKDPDYALAYNGLAYYYFASADFGMSGRDAAVRMREAANKALQLDPNIAEAHVWLGYASVWLDYDDAAAKREYQTALAMQPDLANAHAAYGFTLIGSGRVDEGLAQARLAAELDPLSAEINTWTGWAYLVAGRVENAITQLRTTTGVDPDFLFAHQVLARAYLAARRPEEALAEAKIASRLAANTSPEADAILGSAYAAAGNRDEARTILEQLRQRSRSAYTSPVYLAMVEASLGQTDEAFSSLDQAYQQRSYLMTNLRNDPIWTPLQQDPRFAELVKKTGGRP